MVHELFVHGVILNQILGGRGIVFVIVFIKNKSDEFEMKIASNRAALKYMRQKELKISSLEKMSNDLEKTASFWASTKLMAPVSAKKIVSTNKIWTEKTAFKIEAYEKELKDKLVSFRSLEFWFFENSDGEIILPDRGISQINDAEKNLEKETRIFEENEYLCSIFELDERIAESRSIVCEMKQDLIEMRKLWKVHEELNEHIESSKALLWTAVDPEVLEDGAKLQLKAVKSLHKCTRWSNAFKFLDRNCKDFLSSIPLIGLLRSKSMRPRHWNLLVEVKKATNFTPPCDDISIKLEQIFALDLTSISNEVEEICDQAIKEEKMENTLKQIEEIWCGIKCFSFI